MGWNSDFAYLVGLITSDGNLSKDGRHINITSKDLEQILHVEKVLQTGNKISMKARANEKEKKYYYLQFSDVKLYRFLVSIGLLPCKSRIIKEVLVPHKYFADFLRGCMDGDGCAYAFMDKRWQNSYCIYSAITSASHHFLEWMKSQCLVLFQIKGNITSAGIDAFQLVFPKKASLQLFKVMYYDTQVLHLSRKKLKIDGFLRYNQLLSKNIL